MSMSMTTGIGGVITTVPVSGGGERMRSVWYPKGKATLRKGKANDEVQVKLVSLGLVGVAGVFAFA